MCTNKTLETRGRDLSRSAVNTLIGCWSWSEMDGRVTEHRKKENSHERLGWLGHAYNAT